MVRLGRFGRGRKVIEEEEDRAVFEREHIDSIFIDPPKPVCPTICCTKYCRDNASTIPDEEDADAESEYCMLSSRLFAAFMALCQVGIGVTSIVAAQQGIVPAGKYGEGSTNTTDCPLQRAFLDDLEYGEPSFTFMLFGIVALLALIGGPYGVIFWTYIIGLPAVAFLYINFPRWEEICPEESLDTFFVIVLAQFIVSGLCWLVFVLVCLGSIAFECYIAWTQDFEDEGNQQVPNLAIEVQE